MNSFFLVVGHELLSDSSEDDSDSEQTTGKSSPFSKKKKNKNVPPINPHRSIEELEEYRRHFDLGTNQNEDDELKSIYEKVDANWTRSQTYGIYFKSLKDYKCISIIDR